MENNRPYMNPSPTNTCVCMYATTNSPNSTSNNQWMCIKLPLQFVGQWKAHKTPKYKALSESVKVYR